MPALPLLLTQSEGLHPSISPQPQRPPPPRQTKLAVAGPAELVTCDQTIERENGRLKHEWALLPLRVRRLERVQLHADLTILARLTVALAKARAVPLAA